MPGKNAAGDLYSLLGVPRNATLSAIRTAYRGKVEQHHPSKGGDQEAFARIREAYAVLISSERRAHYDDTGDILNIEETREGGARSAASAEARLPPQSARRSKSESRPSSRRSRDACSQEAPLDRPAALKSPAGGHSGAAQRPRAESVPRPQADQRAAPRARISRRNTVEGEAPPARVNFAEEPAAASLAGSEANSVARTAFQPMHDAPAKSKPCLDSPAREKPCFSSGPPAAEVTASVAGPPAKPATALRSGSARPSAGHRGASVPKFMGSRASARERETDADSQAGSNASTATPSDAQHADPGPETARGAAERKTDARTKALTLAEALAAAEAMADIDTAVEPAADVAGKAKHERVLAPETPPEEEEEEQGLPELYATVDCDGPLAYRCSQGVLFAKRSVEPTSKNIVKLARPIGMYVYSTGRRWKGPSGGTWCELARRHIKEDNARWMLVKGPGFDLGGPALIDASVLKAGGLYEAACLKVHHVGYRAVHTVIFESFMSKDATMWGVKKAIQEATGLNANRCYLSRQLASTAPRPPGVNDEASRRIPDLMLQHVKDEQIIRDLNMEEEDVMLYLVYTGDFERDYKPTKTFGDGCV